MDSWLVTDSLFNNEIIQIGDIYIMTSTYALSWSFGSRVRSKYIGHTTYTVRSSNFHLKTHIHGLFHKSDFNDSYSRSNFSRLPQAVAKKYFMVCLRKLVMIPR